MGLEKLTDVTFKQEDLDKMFADARGKGAEKGRRELLESVGFDNVHELTKAVQAGRDAEQSARTQAEADLAADRKRLDEERAEFEKEKEEVRLESALVHAGVQDGYVKDALKLVDRTSIDESVTDLQKRYPGMFTSKNVQPEIKGVPAAQSHETVPGAFGIEAAKQRFGGPDGRD